MGFKEFDFRFPGLDPERHPQRVRRLRDRLLALAGGFTEIRPDLLHDLLPGKGTGYIVALPQETRLDELHAALGALAAEWGQEAPRPVPANEGPRSRYGFFLVPRLSNQDADGTRRDLFSLGRWSELERAVRGLLIRPIVKVYGEWESRGSGRGLDEDDSWLFLFAMRTGCSELVLERIIRQHVFDGGKECDQESIYLSVAGEGRLVYENR